MSSSGKLINSTTIVDDSIVNADIAAAAAIVASKLAAGGTANRVVATADGATMAMQQIVSAMIANNAIAEIVFSYTGGVMHNGTSLTGATELTFLANQTFSVTSTSSVIGIFTSGGGQIQQVAAGQVASRAYIDWVSAGSPGTRYDLGSQRVVVANEFSNSFSGHGGTFLTGLTAGTHTIRFAVISEANGLVYQRANGYESFGFDIVEWKR